MALKFRRGTTAQKSGSLAFGEPYVNTTLGTLQIGLESGDVTLTAIGTGSNISVAGISGSSLDITGNAKIDGNLTLGGEITSSMVEINSGSNPELRFNNRTTGIGYHIQNGDGGNFQIHNSTNNKLLFRFTSASVDYGNQDASFYSNLYVSKSVSANILYANGIEADSITGSITGSIYGVGDVVQFSSSIDNQLTNLNTYTGSVDTKNNTLASYTGSIDSKFSNLATTTSSLLVSQTNLNTYTGSIDSKFSNLETTTSSLLVSETNLNTYTSSLLGAFQVTGSKVNFLGDVTIYGTQSVINSTNVELADNILYLAPTSSADNDLGIVGHYNDGTYRHAGIFMDASDGHAWKVFNGLQDETLGVVNTSGTGFTLADFKAGAITGTSFTGNINSTNGVISGSSQIDVSSTTGNVALGSKTTGDYVGTITAGAGVSSTGATSGEGIAHTISIGQSVATSANVSFNTIASTVATGTAPLSVSSTTAVTNLNADLWDGYHFATYLNQPLLTTSAVTHGNLTINGTITASGDITAYYTSDRRHKNNIKVITNALDKVKKLNGVTWEWNDDVNEVTKSTPTTGLIAQEVQEVLPEVVVERENGYLGLDYSKMMGLLVEAIKEQQIKIDNLTVEVERLKKQKGL